MNQFKNKFLYLFSTLCVYKVAFESRILAFSAHSTYDQTDRTMGIKDAIAFSIESISEYIKKEAHSVYNLFVELFTRIKNDPLTLFYIDPIFVYAFLVPVVLKFFIFVTKSKNKYLIEIKEASIFTAIILTFFKSRSFKTLIFFGLDLDNIYIFIISYILVLVIILIFFCIRDRKKHKNCIRKNHE